MKHNLNLLEVIIRLSLAMLLIIGTWLVNSFILFPIGMVLVVTALAGYCPIYHMLGIDRNHKKEHN